MLWAPSGPPALLQPAPLGRVLPADLQEPLLFFSMVRCRVRLPAYFTFLPWPMFDEDHPTCLIFNFRCYFLCEHAFFYGCFFWKNNLPWASVGTNGTFIYDHRQLPFLGGQLCFGREINPLATWATLFHICGLREGEKPRTLATSVHEGFSVVRLGPRKTAPSSVSLVLQKNGTVSAHTPFQDQALKGLGLSYTSASLILERTDGFLGAFSGGRAQVNGLNSAGLSESFAQSAQGQALKKSPTRASSVIASQHVKS